MREICIERGRIQRENYRQKEREREQKRKRGE